jgi:hypothetical protein
MLRFTIRELFLLTLCVAIAVGWWLERGQLLRDKSAAENQLATAESLYKDAEVYRVELHARDLTSMSKVGECS